MGGPHYASQGTDCGEQQFAPSELAIGQSIAVPDSNANTVDAASQFIAQGARWVPSKALARAIDDAALGRNQVPAPWSKSGMRSMQLNIS